MAKPTFTSAEIHAIMDAYGDTPDSFAERAGIARTAVARYLKRGTVGESLEVLEKLSALERAKAKKEPKKKWR